MVSSEFDGDMQLDDGGAGSKDGGSQEKKNQGKKGGKRAVNRYQNQELSAFCLQVALLL